MLEKNYGILTVEEVSEGFIQLVENCGNGAVVIVFKVFLVSLESSKSYNCTVSKKVLILRTWSLIRTFLAFWVLIGSLFIFQGPYFHYLGFIHAKNVNLVSYLQALVSVYTLGKF